MTTLGNYVSKMLNFNSYILTLDPFHWLPLPIIIAIILFYKLFRPYFPVKVNCWFCGTNQIVPYSKRFGFNCSISSCGQYNGFTADGDYNKVIEEQYCEQRHPNGLEHEHSFNLRNHQKLVNNNNGRLCKECNLRQQKKLEKLASFAPTKEKYFEAEYKAYSRRLEQIYELCDSCLQRTSKLLQGQDAYLRNMYFSTPRKDTSNANGPVTPQFDMFSPVPHSAKERQRSRLQRQIIASPSLSPSHFNNSNFHRKRARGQGINSISLIILRSALQTMNLLTSLVVFSYVVCECCSTKAFVASLLVHYPQLDELLRILFDHVVFFYLFGIVTQYFVTLCYRRCKCHLGGLMLWIVTSLLAYNTSSLCRVGLPWIISPTLVLTAALNGVTSAFRLCMEFYRSRKSLRASPGNFSASKTFTNSSSSKVPNSDHSPSRNSYENDKMFAAMKLSKKQPGDCPKLADTGRDSFFFFDHKVKLDEFQVRLRTSQGSPRPLISPPRFSPRIERRDSGFESQFFGKH